MNRPAVRAFAATILAASAVVSTKAASGAAAPDRTVVFIASGAGTDPTLGDNLNEVAIARLAELSPGERVGTHELRRWMEKTGRAEPVPTCISRTPCLRRLGAELGVRKIISGSVLADGEEFTIALTLVDAESGAAEATSTKTVRGELEQVIRAVQDAVVELLRPGASAPRLALTGDPTPATTGNAMPAALVGAEPTVGVARARSAERRWPVYAAIGAAAATVLSFSAAGALGIMANEAPTGATRADMQRDLARRDDYATAANTLWIIGGALGATAVGIYVWQRAQSDGR